MAISHKPTQSQLALLPDLRSARHHSHSRYVPMHSHTVTELVYVIKGHVRVEVSGFTFEGYPGTLYILPANVSHDQSTFGSWHTLCILYDQGEHLLDPAPRKLEINRKDHVYQWMEELCVLHQSEPVQSQITNGFLFSLLSKIGRLENQRREAEALHPRLAAAVHYIHKHLTRDVDSHALARAAGASYSHLGALFLQKFGHGPLKYHQILRMEAACKLLQNPYLHIDEVAQQVGFNDANYFTRLFRKTYQISPGKWRQRFRK